MMTVTFDEGSWKLVPVEPTEEMIQAACLNQASLDTYPNYEAWWDSHSSGISEKIRGYVSGDYRAMIAAAPTAQEVTQQAAPIQSIHYINEHGDRVELQILHGGPTARGFEITVATPTQQAAKAETAEQAEGEQANVLPPTRGTGGHYDTNSAADDQWVFDLAAEHEANRNGLYGPVTFDATGLLDFARAIEAEVACRCCAQREDKPNSSDLAPTTSTVSAPEEVRHYDEAMAREAWACVRKNNHSIPDDALDDMRNVLIRALRTTSGKGEAT